MNKKIYKYKLFINLLSITKYESGSLWLWPQLSALFFWFILCGPREVTFPLMALLMGGLAHKPRIHPTASIIKSKFFGPRLLPLARILNFYLCEVRVEWETNRKVDEPIMRDVRRSGEISVPGPYTGNIWSFLSELSRTKCFLLVDIPKDLCCQPQILFQMWGIKTNRLRKLRIENISSLFYLEREETP